MTGLRRSLLPLLAGAALACGGLFVPVQASPAHAADQPFCGQVWGSLPEGQQLRTSGDLVTDVRAGRHACFDRLVIDLRGSAEEAPSYDVRYVEGVSEQGSGRAIPLRGGASLQVLIGAAAYDDGRATYRPYDGSEVVDTAGFDTIRQVAWAGSYEGQTGLAIGTRARLPFRVFTLLGESGDDQAVRLVIDVGHRW